MTETCTFRDAVVARFLDGDGTTLRDGSTPSELTAHLVDCEACRSYLARGRRLDALLAGNSGVGSEVDPAQAERLLAGVRAAAAAPAPRVQQPWMRRLLPQAALVACGFAAAVALGVLSGEEPPAAPARTSAQPADEDVARAPELGDAIPVPDLPRTRTAPGRATGRTRALARGATAADVVRLEQLAGYRSLARVIQLDVVLRALALDLPLRRFMGLEWGPKAESMFYDWLVLHATHRYRRIRAEIGLFAGFTDIDFQPRKTNVCHARSCAYFAALVGSKLLDEVISSQDRFFEVMLQDPFYKAPGRRNR